MSRPRPGPRARLALRLAASVAVLAAVAAVFGPRAVGAGAQVLRPAPLLAALGLGALFVAVSAARWVVVARAAGAPLRWRRALPEYYRSELVNQLLPGGVLGDLDRARRHGRRVGLWRSAGAVAVERIVGQLVLAAAALVALLTHPALLAPVAPGAPAVALTAAAVVAGVLAGTWWWARRRGLAVRWSDVAAVTALSAGGTGCLLALFAVAAAATGVTVPVATLLPVVLVVLSVSALPVGLAGWGTREAATALTFVAVGLAGPDGVTASVGYGLLALVAASPGAVPLLGLRRRPQVEVEADVPPERHRT